MCKSVLKCEKPACVWSRYLLILMLLLNRWLLSIINLVNFISIFILKAIYSTWQLKQFSFKSSLQAFKRYIGIYKEQKGHSIEENFFHLFKEQMKTFFALITKKKEKWLWMNGKMMTLKNFKLYTVDLKN